MISASQEHKDDLIQQAINKYINIYPVGRNTTFNDECFTMFRNKLMFWFNTKDGSTHIIKKDIFN